MNETAFRRADDVLATRLEGYRLRRHEIRGSVRAAVLLEEMQASLRLAGVPYALPELRGLVERRAAIAERPLRDVLVAVGYAAAAQLAARRQPVAQPPYLALAEVRHLHAVAAGPEASLEPLGGRAVGVPGSWRTSPSAPYEDGTVPTPPWRIPAAMETFVARTAAGPPPGESARLWLAQGYEQFIRIRPFPSANGRVARLLTNVLLARLDHPPWLLAPPLEARYFPALREADNADPWPLALLVVDGLNQALDRLTAGLDGERLRSLSELAPGAQVERLRKAALRGRLRHVRRGGRVFSTPAWIAEYERSKSRAGRPPGGS